MPLFTTAFPFSFPWPAQVYAVLNKYPNPLAPHVVSMDVLERTILPDGTIRSERLIGVQQDSPRWVTRLLGTPDVTFVREVSFVVPSCLPNPSQPAASVTTSTTAHLEPPKLLMASTNLTLSYLLQCRESISYLPHPWPYTPETASTLAPLADQISLREDDEPATSPLPSNSPKAHPLSHPTLPPSTLFSQSALIYSTGMMASNPYPPIGISKHSPIPPLSQPRAGTAPQRAAGKRVERWSTDRFEMNAENGRRAMEYAAGRFWDEFMKDASLNGA
ncbi:hypothetical protein T439DRAFT_324991 [Meredithblackwellia eburnea MCA 4105]